MLYRPAVEAVVNGIANAAVGYGYGSREELLAEAPDYFFATLDELSAALRVGEL